MKLTFSDKNHSYYLDGRRCKSVTAIAKLPDDTYALEEWRKRMVAIGMATEPSLIERVAAHFDDRSKMAELCEEAMNVAKSHVAAGLGTAAHRIAERVDLGEDIIDTPLSLAFRAAWTLALDKAGLEIIPEYVERIVVYPEQRVCGAFDRIMRRRRDGKLVMVDLKTGEGAVKYPHSIACQIALYVNAPFMAGPMGNPAAQGNVYTETFEPLPELDREVGYIVHAAGVVDGQVAEVLEVDIAAGWQVAKGIIFPALEWRKRDDVMRPIVAVPVAEVEPATDDDFRRAIGEPCLTPSTATTSTVSPSTIMSPGAERASDSSESISTTSRRQQILARLTALPEAQKARIKAHWPYGMAGLKSQIHQHTDAELDAIEAVIALDIDTEAVMAEHPRRTAVDVATMRQPKEDGSCSTSSAGSTAERSSLKASTPATGSMASTSTTAPTTATSTSRSTSTSFPTTSQAPTTCEASSAPDEGPLVPATDVAALRAAFAKLDTAEQLWLSVITQQSNRAGYPLNLGDHPTKRRWAIATALVHCARLGVGTDDTHEATVRALMGVVMGTEIQPAIVTGSAVCRLTIDEAERLAVLAQAVGTDLIVHFDEDGYAIGVYGPAVEAARRVA